MATSHRVSPEGKPAPPNGHAAKRVNGQRNGQLVASSENPADESAGWNIAETGKRDRARAAPDDTHGVSLGASVIAAPPAANTDHDQSAEAARDSSKGKTSSGSAKKRAPRGKKTKETEEREPVPPGLDVLPADGPAFTEALNAQADLLEVGRRLLNSSDERIIKGVWEHMLELRYGKEAPMNEDARRIVIDVERPNYDDLPTQ